MEICYLFLGMSIGIIIGQHNLKHQITKKKNKTVIEQVKKWIAEAEKETRAGKHFRLLSI